MVNLVRRAGGVLRYGLLVLRWCGLRVFLRKLLHQLYGRTVFLVEEGRLDDADSPSSFRGTVSRATPAEVDELFRGLRRESRQGRYQLLIRKRYHERGFGDCIIVRASDTGEICAVRWMVTPGHIRRLGWESLFPLEEDQVMLENSYTLERYRRQGVKTAALPQCRDIAIGLGFTRTKGYLDEANIPTLTSAEKQGGLMSARVIERHTLFRVTREIIQRYDPPIPITVAHARRP